MQLRLITLERWLLFATLFAILLPLRLVHGYFGMALFEVPMVLLFTVAFLRRLPQRGAAPRLILWDVGWFVLAIWVLLPTLLHSAETLPALMVWIAAVPLAIYARLAFGEVYDLGSIRRFALGVLVFEIGVGLVQLLTRSNFGDVQSYFGSQSDGTQTTHALELLHRVVGTLGLPNLYGNWLATLLPFCWVLFVDPRRELAQWKRFLSLGLTFLVLTMLLLSVSRTNTAVAGMGLILLWAVIRFRHGGRFDARAFLRYAAAAALVAVAVIFVADVIEQRLYGFSVAAMDRLQGTGAHFEFRMEQYRGAMISILRHPLFGVGFGNSPNIWWNVGANLPLAFSFAPHNLYLILATEGGLPTLGLFGVLVGSPLVGYARRLRRHSPDSDALVLAVVSFLLVGMAYVVTINHGVWPLFMFLVGALRAEVGSKGTGDGDAA